MEFGFFRGLPKDLVFLDIAGQIAFLIDIMLQFFLAYRDTHTYRMVYKRTSIALRIRKVTDFFQKMEKDIRINYMFTYCAHTAACIFYYLATTLPQSEEGYTWIGSLKLGDYTYSHFREIDIWKRYTTSLSFSSVNNGHSW
uniref:Ion transport domain-containing protein n=1 Tax=Vitis vinifera TaxID=29760 RepID=F6HSG6_VITVI